MAPYFQDHQLFEQEGTGWENFWPLMAERYWHAHCSYF
jgi:hypothetical protein